MLIEAYEVRVFRCSSCGGPVQGAEDRLPDSCRYCGADAGLATNVGAFSHEIRVLACDGCAAPIGVPIGGGRVACEFCNTTVDIVARREVPLGTGGRIDDPQRLAGLRAQDRSFVHMGETLGRLMRRGGLVDETFEEAETLWKKNRRALRQLAERRGEREATIEKEFYGLTELLADYHSRRNRRLVSRGFLESALAQLLDRRYLQSIYAWLARNAESTGDSASADAWLELCDPCPEDLSMDSAVRFTWASLAIRRGDVAGIFAALGHTRADIPLASKFDTIADVLLIAASFQSSFCLGVPRIRTFWQLPMAVIRGRTD